MTIFEKIKNEIEARKNRSAWDKGVNLYALEILETIEERTRYEHKEPETEEDIKDYALNGAKNWSVSSWGGCYEIYDGAIAERLCTPSELKRTKNGERRPNSCEEWLDVQARALSQAYSRVLRLWKRSKGV